MNLFETGTLPTNDDAVGAHQSSKIKRTHLTKEEILPLLQEGRRLVIEQNMLITDAAKKVGVADNSLGRFIKGKTHKNVRRTRTFAARVEYTKPQKTERPVVENTHYAEATPVKEVQITTVSGIDAKIAEAEMRLKILKELKTENIL